MRVGKLNGNKSYQHSKPPTKNLIVVQLLCSKLVFHSEHLHNLISRPSHQSVLDCLQYAKLVG